MNLKQIRQNQGITQTEMAKKLGVSRPTYIQIERGKKEPTVSQARIIAELIQLNRSQDPQKKVQVVKKSRKQNSVQFDSEKFKEVILYILEKVVGSIVLGRNLDQINGIIR